MFFFLVFVLAGLGDLRNDHDPSVTYEGDNTVLVQQTSNWLVRQWSVKNVTSPLHTIDFLQRKDVLHRARFTGSLLEDVANLSCKYPKKKKYFNFNLVKFFWGKFKFKKK